MAASLVEAANEAGGKDNITALFVAGPEFRGRAPSQPTTARERQSTTRPSGGSTPAGTSILTGRIAFLIYGLLIGMLLWAVPART